MDALLIFLGITLLLAGLAGAVLPIPGPPLSFAGLWILDQSRHFEFSFNTLTLYGLATLALVFFDYYAPIWGVKKMGGTKAGSIGSTIGMCLGLFFFPPFGLFIGAFLGAYVAELRGGLKSDKALRAAAGSFLGFIVGMVAKIAICLLMIFSTIQAYTS